MIYLLIYLSGVVASYYMTKKALPFQEWDRVFLCALLSTMSWLSAIGAGIAYLVLHSESGDTKPPKWL